MVTRQLPSVALAGRQRSTPEGVEVDDFGELMRAELARHGFTLRAAAAAMHRDPAYVSRVRSGRQAPSEALARDLDGLLGTSKFTDVVKRQASVVSSSTVDPAAVAAMRALLDSSRLVDDALGSSAVAPTARLQMRQVTGLARDGRGPHRDALVNVAAGWGIFAGWVLTATGQWGPAATALGRASEWAAEVADPTLSSIAWSFRAYLASARGRHVEALGLSTAAARTTGTHPAQEAYTALQRARMLAELGEQVDARRGLEAASGMFDAVETEGEPPTEIYWNRRPFFELHAGRTCLLLGEAADAAALLSAGLSGLPEEQAAAVWTQKYRTALESAQAAA